MPVQLLTRLPVCSANMSLRDLMNWPRSTADMRKKR